MAEERIPLIETVDLKKILTRCGSGVTGTLSV